MNARSLLAGTGLATLMVVLANSAVMAAPIDFGGFNGPITIKYNNYEDFSASQTLEIKNGMGKTVAVTAPAIDSLNFGIFAIDSAQANDAGKNILNQSLYTYVGLFYGIETTAVDPFTAGSKGVGFESVTTGGTFVLYQIPNVDIPSLAAVESQGSAGYSACPLTLSCYNGITNATGATDVLQWSLGTNNLDPTYSLTLPGGSTSNLGSAGADAIITGGTDAGQFGSTLSLEDDFCFNNGTGTGECGSGVVKANKPANNWQLLSQDPVNATTAVPEPSSVALFGAGLLALAGLFGWRRRRANW